MVILFPQHKVTQSPRVLFLVIASDEQQIFSLSAELKASEARFPELNRIMEELYEDKVSESHHKTFSHDVNRIMYFKEYAFNPEVIKGYNIFKLLIYLNRRFL
ncbi:hypothetical protein SDC9_83948 [bioreactor metagenome]|uniref:Uncharacterized protein n=1 Tax=bioreactor metagenome TaxID=1076179 RepID=A0A644ZAL7_9ZZZZ|nr:hypothetical protein [Oscillospiraceae bacterium]